MRFSQEVSGLLELLQSRQLQLETLKKVVITPEQAAIVDISGSNTGDQDLRFSKFWFGK
jgi:hypothetical protein